MMAVEVPEAHPKLEQVAAEALPRSGFLHLMHNPPLYEFDYSNVEVERDILE